MAQSGTRPPQPPQQPYNTSLDVSSSSSSSSSSPSPSSPHIRGDRSSRSRAQRPDSHLNANNPAQQYHHGGGKQQQPYPSNGPPPTVDPRDLSIMPSHPYPQTTQDGIQSHHQQHHHAFPSSIDAPTASQAHLSDGMGQGDMVFPHGQYHNYQGANDIADRFASLSHHQQPSHDDISDETDDDDDDLSTSSGRRHGNLLQPEPEDYVVTESPYMTHWFSKRHLTGGNPKPRSVLDLPDWRMRERLRTVTAALVMCLNIGVDPPDVSKTNPCSKLICWMDPSSLEVSKALPAIGKNLQAQFETLSMKTRYKQYLDPIVEETKRFCTALRRTAKDERVLFYYNGFGVPKPTPGGEIWVFNKAYTQYIPVTLYDLQNWLGNPCIFVWDASAAGNVVVNFKKLAERRAEEEAKIAGSSANPTSNPNGAETQFPLRESIHLAACAPDEILPMNPDLPADLFTCCLTSPIEISLRWFVLQNPLPSKLNVDMVMNIPGRLQDRRTPLGELNWIFTAITDTIAWTVLPRSIFRRLFRDDLMVAALLRNFLLAERIMRFYHCTPMSHPKLPSTHNHPLWNSWDLAVDQCLAQLPMLLEKEKAQRIQNEGGPPMDPKLVAFEYRHSTFFSEQLKAFEVWLSQGGVSRQGRRRRAESALASIRLNGKSGSQKRTPNDMSGSTADDLPDDEDDENIRQVLDPPDQLPIVLQVLLSQVHRLRALILLSQFLDLGPRAVNLALSIGIFPYVLKLLQSPAVDLKPVLIYIWARILAVDRSCQNDLLRDNGFVYFVGVLSPFQQPNAPGGAANGAANGSALPIPNVSEHRAMCAFILSVFCQDFPAGQQACLHQTDAMDSCLEHLEDDDFLLRQWSALCLAQLWDGSDEGKAIGIKKDAHGKLCYMLGDVSPEVRAAVLYALGTLLGSSGSSVDPFDPISSMSTSTSGTARAANNAPRHRCLGTGTLLDLEESAHRKLEIGIAIAMLSTRGDCSPMVRKELIVALSAVVREYQGFFVLAAYLYYDDEDKRLRASKRQASSSDLRNQVNSLSNGKQSSKNSTRGLQAVYETSTLTSQPASRQRSTEGSNAQEPDAVLTRTLTKLALEEGLTEEDISNLPAFSTLFVSLLDLSVDGYTEVAGMAKTVVDYIVALLIESEVARASESIARLFAVNGDKNTNRPDGGRLVLPTGMHNAEDSYFSYTPQSSNGISASEGLLSPTGTAFGPHPGSTTPHHGGSHTPGRNSTHAKRTPSLAQAVKAIATLGYSRPSSPAPSPEGESPSEGSFTAASAYNPAANPRIPTPRYNVMGYISPFEPKSGDGGSISNAKQGNTASTPGSPSSTSSSSAAALLARRSASAESLAHIARRQSQQTLGPNSRTSSSGLGSGSGMNSPSRPLEGSAENGGSSAADSPDEGPPSHAETKIADTLTAIVAVDLQRYRNRAALAAEGAGGASAGNTPMSSPMASRSGLKSLLSDAGLGNDDIRETLPLKSRLFSWCSEYYREPQMKPAESEEPGSVKYNVHTWKRQRNERIVTESQSKAEAATEVDWTQPVSTMRNGAPPYLMLMHQFENHLVTASEKDVVSVWDWERARLLSRFHNGNPSGTNITSALFINEEVDGLLLVGSAEGDVRIYRNYDRPTWMSATRGPELISTFRALPDLVRSRFPSGLVADWQQVTGHLLAGGDSRVIRVWDAHRELCVCDIPTRTSSCVTSISSETDIGHIFVAGFGNGTVGVYDRRNPPEASLVRLWEEHQSWIHKVHLQQRGNRELLSASDDGEVRLWDIRGRSSISKSRLGGPLRGKMSAFAVHERMPVFAAAGTPRQGRNGAVTPLNILQSSFTKPLNTLGDAEFKTPSVVRHFGSTSAGLAAAAASHGRGGYSGGHQSGSGHGSGGGGLHSSYSHGHLSSLGQSGHGGHQGHGHHGSNHHSIPGSTSNPLPPIVPIDAPISNFTPAMSSLAFHPHWPLMAHSGPDLAGTIEVKKLPQEKNQDENSAGSGGNIEGTAALPSYDSMNAASGLSGEGQQSNRRRSFLGVGI
ncbi:unnamed protein product [Sympodiomycopsis kandeliae]